MHSNKSQWRTLLAVIALTVAAPLAIAQHEQHAAHSDQQNALSVDQMKQKCQQMMQMRQKMMQAEKQMDQQLQQKLQAMDKAQGQAKVDAMAAVIKELVQQRQQMHEQRQQMMQSMMQHMGQHMEMGMQGDGKQAMMNCPMMQGPASAGTGQSGAQQGHEAHH